MIFFFLLLNLLACRVFFKSDNLTGGCRKVLTQQKGVELILYSSTSNAHFLVFKSFCVFLLLSLLIWICIFFKSCQVFVSCQVVWLISGVTIMGYKKVLRFVSDSFFFLPHSLVIFLLLVEAVNELRTEKTKIGILLNSIFISLVYNYFVVGEHSFWAWKKLSSLQNGVKRSDQEFLYGTRRPNFLGMYRLCLLSEASWEIVIFELVYFILCLFFFIFCY